MLALFDRREPDIPVADLVHDSLLDGAAPAAGTRVLRFTGESATVELVVTATAAGRDVQVQVSPPASYHLVARSGDDIVVGDTDEHGVAALAAVPTGIVSVLVDDATGAVVRTMQLGAQSAGDVRISWDGRNDNGVLMGAGDYTLNTSAVDASGAAVSATVNTSGTVSGVAFQGGVPLLKVGDTFVKMSDVTSINESERNTP